MYEPSGIYFVWQNDSAGALNVVPADEVENWPVHMTYTGAELNYVAAVEAAHDLAVGMRRDDNDAHTEAFITFATDNFRALIAFKRERAFTALDEYAKVWDVPWAKPVQTWREGDTEKKREEARKFLDDVLRSHEIFRLVHRGSRKPAQAKRKNRRRRR